MILGVRIEEGHRVSLNSPNRKQRIGKSVDMSLK